MASSTDPSASARDTWFDTPEPKARAPKGTPTVLNIPAPDSTFVRSRAPLIPPNMRARDGKDTLFSAAWFEESVGDTVEWQKVAAERRAAAVAPVSPTADTQAPPKPEQLPRRGRAVGWAVGIALSVMALGVFLLGALLSLGALLALLFA